MLKEAYHEITIFYQIWFTLSVACAINAWPNTQKNTRERGMSTHMRWLTKSQTFASLSRLFIYVHLFVVCLFFCPFLPRFSIHCNQLHRWIKRGRGSRRMNVGKTKFFMLVRIRDHTHTNARQCHHFVDVLVLKKSIETKWNVCLIFFHFCANETCFTYLFFFFFFARVYNTHSTFLFGYFEPIPISKLALINFHLRFSTSFTVAVLHIYHTHLPCVLYVCSV